MTTSSTVNNIDQTANLWDRKWHLLYYLLAIFDLITVSFSLWLCFTIMSIYQSSVDVNAEWAFRAGLYSDINSALVKLNGPGNDVFNNDNVDAEVANLKAYTTEFNSKLAVLKVDTKIVKDKAYRETIEQSQGALMVAVTGLIKEAKSVFYYMRQSDRIAAGKHMSEMDKNFSKASEVLTTINRNIRQWQHNELETQVAIAQRLKRKESLIATAILFVIISILVYGRKVSKQSLKNRKELELAHKHTSKALKDVKIATESKSIFLANMSHEIRTPMNSIIEFSELLMSEDLSKQDQAKMAKIIHSSGSALLVIIDDILDFSKLETGHIQLNKTEFSLKTILDDIYVTVKHLLEKNVVDLIFKYDSNLPELLLGDKDRLRQIILNLVSNAVKFSCNNKVIVFVKTVLIEDEAIILNIKVKDSGIGIAKDKIDTIFEQADVSTNAKFGGTGLRLSISQSILSLMDSRLKVASQLGEGSEFSFTIKLPYIASDASNLEALATSTN